MIHSGKVEGLYLGPEGKVKSTFISSVTATLEGFLGDRHHGYYKRAGVREKLYPKGTIIRNNRQISIVSVEELEEIAASMDIGELKAEWLGANVLLSGIPNLTQIPSLSRLIFENGVVICVYKENLPCVFPGNVIHEYYPQVRPESFPKHSIHLRGLVGWIERPGIIKVGEKVELKLP